MASNKRLQVAIIGRPNVGKSTLYNQLTGTRQAIVRDEPGVTRDIQQGKSDWCGVTFNIFDTGGITSGTEKVWNQEIKLKALQAASMSDKIVLVLDGKYGLNPEDRDLAIQVNKLGKPVIAVINKIDEPKNFEIGLSEFYGLNFKTMVAASFEHKHNLDVILDFIIEGQERNLDDLVDNNMKLAIVGKPNAGKSTLTNSLMGEERVIVSPVAGTTVDSIQVTFTRGEHEYTLIDTAGMRRHAKRAHEVEQLSAFKAEDAVERADVLILVVDGIDGPSQQDARIVELAFEHQKPVILAINKIDLIEKKGDDYRHKMKETVKEVFHFYSDIPVIFMSAQTKRGLGDLFAAIDRVRSQLNLKISTRDINDFFNSVIKLAPSPSFRGNDIKFFYITQTNQKPPSFMTFVNEPRGVTNSYRRFVIKKIKEHYDLRGIPVRLYAKKRKKSQPKSHHEVSEKDNYTPKNAPKREMSLEEMDF